MNIQDLNLPPRSNGNLSARQVILLTPEMDQALRQFAKENNTTISGFVRSVIQRLLDQQKESDNG